MINRNLKKEVNELHDELNNINNLLDIITSKFNENGIYMIVRDENEKIIYPKNLLGIQNIINIFKSNEYNLDVFKEEKAELYDKENDKYYRITSSFQQLNSKKYKIQLIENISEQKFFELKSKYDHNTGLYNSGTILSKLDECIINLNSFSLVICDIDNFKMINDNYSHVAGDIILKEVSNIFLNHIEDDGYVGRYGGDEFILIFKNYTEQQLQDKMNEIINDIRNININYDNKEINNITISCGAYNVDLNQTNILNLETIRKAFFEYADKALYESKKKGKNQLVIYKKES